MCEEAAPSIFRLDDEGELILLLETVPPELERQANEAVRVCPVAALSVRSD
jgi:ferredoxin